MKPLRIMSLPVDDGGCGHYRIRQPFEMIKRFTNDDTHIIDKDEDMEQVALAIPHAHVMVMRPGAEKFMFQMRDRDMFKHLKWVLDIDDNTEIISPYNAHYDEYGVEEYFDKNLNKWLWKDGERGFDIQKNRERIANHVRGLREADLVTVTTPKLAEYASQYNKNVAILPNSINPERWWPLPLRKNRKLRVGWSGGISHYEDWHSIKQPLNELMREMQFTLVIVGNDFKGIIDEDNRHLVESHDWVPFKGHSYRMMCMNLDFAIIPLADLPFNHFKSAIKWYEFSAMKIPCVVSAVTPYREEIHNTFDCWTYTNKDNFKKAVYGASESLQARKERASIAQNYVLRERNAQKNAKLWTQAYRSML